jgi:hypothetical protein
LVLYCKELKKRKEIEERKTRVFVIVMAICFPTIFSLYWLLNFPMMYIMPRDTLPLWVHTAYLTIGRIMWVLSAIGMFWGVFYKFSGLGKYATASGVLNLYANINMGMYLWLTPLMQRYYWNTTSVHYGDIYIWLYMSFMGLVWLPVPALWTTLVIEIPIRNLWKHYADAWWINRGVKK